MLRALGGSVYPYCYGVSGKKTRIFRSFVVDVGRKGTGMKAVPPLPTSQMVGWFPAEGRNESGRSGSPGAACASGGFSWY